MVKPCVYPRTGRTLPATSNMPASNDGRPTFGTYWRKRKEDSAVKSVVFVQSDPSQPSDKGTFS